MLSVNLLERHFTTGRYEALLDGLAANGLELPLPLHARLSEHAAAAATALGLRRLTELTYGPTTLSRLMTQTLLGLQEADGSFGHDPLATAAAAAALERLAAEQPAPGAPGNARNLGPSAAGVENAARASEARQRALAALAGMQADDGLFRSGDDRTEQDRALTAAFVLYLLAGCDEFRAAVRFADLMTWFELRQRKLEDETARLWRLARVGAPGPRRLSPAVAAIAA